LCIFSTIPMPSPDTGIDILTGPFGSRASAIGVSTRQIFLEERFNLAVRIQAAFREAGATLPVTPTFGATVRGVHGGRFDEELHRWNTAAVRTTRQAFPGLEPYGSIAPILDSSGKDDSHAARLHGTWTRRHTPQINALRDAGVRHFLGEAFRYLREARDVAELLANAGAKSFLCSFEAKHPKGKFPHQPELKYEHVLNELVNATRGRLEVTIGINCAGVDYCTQVLKREKAGTIGAVYPNRQNVGNDPASRRFLTLAQSQRMAEEEAEYRRLQQQLDTKHDALAALAQLCAARRVPIIGICCGGTPEDVRALRRAVDRVHAPRTKHVG
jgi:S-methylmethionine-dependent homocysteine/selenocysteine methylase